MLEHREVDLADRLVLEQTFVHRALLSDQSVQRDHLPHVDVGLLRLPSGHQRLAACST